MGVNTQENIYIYIYIYIYIWIDDAVFAADFVFIDAVFVFFKKINLRSWEGGVKPVLDRPKQG